MSTGNTSERSLLTPKGFSYEAKDADKDWMLISFNLIAYITIASATTVIFTQIMLIFGSVAYDPTDVIIRLYGILLCIGVILCELELTEVVRTFIVLQNWISRGFAYIFVAMLALNHGTLNLDSTTMKYVEFSTSSLICLGSLYIFMGIFCLKKLRDDKMARYIQLLSHLEIQKVISNSKA